MGEQVLRRTAQQRRDRLDALPPRPLRPAAGLRDYEFMDADARDAFNALTDELRQQLLQTYFQGLKQGVQGISPEDLDGVRAMVRDLNELLDKHAAGVRYQRRLRRASWLATAQYFPPGIETVDELIDHLHRQASQMASLMASLSPEMRAELQQMMDELLRDDRLRWDMARLAGTLRRCGPTSRSASRIRSAATSRWACRRRWPPSTGSSSSRRHGGGAARCARPRRSRADRRRPAARPRR